jgi:hypothetical protein
MILLHPQLLAEPGDKDGTAAHNPEQANANQTLHGLSAGPGQTSPKPLFTVCAYSLEQARALVAAKVAGETIVVPISLRPTSPLWDALNGASR